MEVLKKHIGQILSSVIIAVIGVFCSVVPYFALAKITQNIAISNTDLEFYIRPILLILGGLIGSVIFHEISTLISHNLAFRIIEDERKKLVRKINRLSMGEIEKRSSGEWTQFMVETLNKIEQPIAHVIPEVIANLIIPIALVVIVFIIDWRIGIANLITLPLGVLFSILMMGGYEEKSRNYQEAAKNMNTTAVEYIRGIQVIKAFNKSASSYGKFVDAVNSNRDSMLNWYLSVCFYMTAAMEVLPSTLLFVLPTSLYLYMNGSIEVGNLIMCVLLSYACYKPLIKAMSHMDTMANVRVVIDEIKNVMELPELERGNGEEKIRSYDINFENVCFAYNDKKKVFDNLSFSAKENKLTAIVGYSGGGKSTIAKLIAGYWNINKGKISVGNVNLKDVSLEKNMELVTYVSQENYLFRKSIIDNMRMANQNASIEEIKDACKKASCHDFIMSLPNGYETIIGESGSNLSGGERQRLTIARALLKDSPIVLLDEATAYSDPDNEAEIQKSIDALVENKTVIMIAHRLSTIIGADKIIVLNNGEIEAEGTHKELLGKSETYAKMWKSHISLSNDRGE
ncbi:MULTISPECIES: ABC transporter ATP-binding protein [Lactobacillales]|uniref:ABC transporter ATP-binding protein n=1 Tax=Facklamia hominis TaxID=178214 RepID=A0AAJ1Q2R4_9LACT|nr:MULTISPECIES: ABC transporter ATP-binding protein [Lactobacillales]HEN9925061.1 ABC transporter ATP-binding protein [Streptococcus agalactiae]MCW0947047.1 ABC transporter ATP-binding protein/permease [Streptococcus anginosus]MCY3061773.1 ABC transporter ATP-binding protein/permease [Aerococcus sp. Group 1]MDK7186592.1 ABC transporter ATP-binding protein [Facklamia hominis]OFL67296.1 ABC transporter ATP-binding protein [Facklamia sp. HMSC062C11]